MALYKKAWIVWDPEMELCVPGGHFRSKLVRLLGLGYALRVKLPLFIFAGFAFSHLVINYIPRIVLELDFEEEEVYKLLPNVFLKAHTLYKPSTMQILPKLCVQFLYLHHL